MNYQELFNQSIEDPEAFWAKAAEEIHWYKKWDKVLDDSNPPFYRWFTGGEMNTCYNALDRHVEAGNGDRIALIYDSPVTNGTIKKYTYSELTELVAKFSCVLLAKGVEKGDTVIIYMPMIPEAMIAVLACARIGAIHSVVFGGFAPRELAIRIDDAKPKAIVTSTCGIEPKRTIPYIPLLNNAIDLADFPPQTVIIHQRPEVHDDLIEGRDFDWDELMAIAEPVPCEVMKATDPLYILYTSGTTGIPKGVVRDNGGHAVALQWTMKHIYGIEPGDIWWTASDVGWVVGHSYIIYAPLLLGATTVMYEGKPIGTPDPGAFWRVIAQHKVKALFTAPTALRAIKKNDPEGEYLQYYKLSHFKTLFLAGERTDPDTYHWAGDLLGVPVIDHWWQTETAWAIAGNFMGLEFFQPKPGSASKPVPGYDVRILDSDGNEQPKGEEGIIAVKLPLPPGTLMTLWNDDKRYKESYMDPFPGYYFTGDGGYIDEDDFVFVMGRVDDVINVAGHRLSTGGMEEIISHHPDVAECAVVGVNDNLKGQVPIGFVVLKKGVERNRAIILNEVIQSVRDKVGAIACFKQAAIVRNLPKTRSGKTLRGTIRKIADAQEYRMPSTIDDPTVLIEIGVAVGTMGYGKHEDC